MANEIKFSVDKNSEKAVIDRINKVLTNTRREGPVLVKKLARNASNSAAKLTIPHLSKGGGGKINAATPSRHRKPKLADKFRPVVAAKTQFHGSFYIVKDAKRGKNKKKGKRTNGYGGTQSERRVMRSASGDVVIYTTKKVSQKNKRFKKVNKLIKAYDKSKKRFRYIPTTTAGKKFDKKSGAGRIPHWFTAKMAWLFSSAPISKSIQKLNPNVRNYGSMINQLSKKDNPSVTMINSSNYAHKRGGKRAPSKALKLAMRGLMHELENTKKKIIKK